MFICSKLKLLVLHVETGLVSALEIFNNETPSNQGTKRVVILMTNTGVVQKHRVKSSFFNRMQKGTDATIKEAVAKLVDGRHKVKMMVNTIMPECLVDKTYCLNCCPDFNFLRKYITRREQICDQNYEDCLKQINYRKSR